MDDRTVRAALKRHWDASDAGDFQAVLRGAAGNVKRDLVAGHVTELIRVTLDRIAFLGLMPRRAAGGAAGDFEGHGRGRLRRKQKGDISIEGENDKPRQSVLGPNLEIESAAVDVDRA